VFQVYTIFSLVVSLIPINLKDDSSAKALISANNTPSLSLKVFTSPALLQVSAERVPIVPD
jgi:hypothetical protein